MECSEVIRLVYAMIGGEKENIYGCVLRKIYLALVVTTLEGESESISDRNR